MGQKRSRTPPSPMSAPDQDRLPPCAGDQSGRPGKGRFRWCDPSSGSEARDRGGAGCAGHDQGFQTPGFERLQRSKRLSAWLVARPRAAKANLRDRDTRPAKDRAEGALDLTWLGPIHRATQPRANGARTQPTRAKLCSGAFPNPAGCARQRACGPRANPALARGRARRRPPVGTLP